MNDIKAAVIGGDMRQKYLIASLKAKGFTVSSYGIIGEDSDTCLSLSEALNNADIAILPYPVSPDGVYLNAVCKDCSIKMRELFSEIRAAGIKTVYGGGFKKSVSELAHELGITLFDYGESEAVKIRNALCTAEGALEIAMRELPINLHGSKCAVLGYGRIGRLLCHRLKALGADTYAVARKPDVLACAETEGMRAVSLSDIKYAISGADIIFNTAPALILGKDALDIISTDCLIIDLASSPGGVDFSEAERLGLKVIWALSLPGKCSPKSAAEIICDAITEQLKNN